MIYFLVMGSPKEAVLKDKLEHKLDEKIAVKPEQQQPTANLTVNEANPAVTLQRILSASPSISAADVLTLQRTVGNQGVLQLLSTKSQEQPKEATGTAYVTNNSLTTIYYKPEDEGTALPVEPNGKCYEPIDGVATHKYGDQVYKVITGTRVTIDEDGDVDPDLSIPMLFPGQRPSAISLPMGDVANFVMGGWKDKEWLDKRYKEGDTGWGALFDKAAIIGSPREDIWEKLRYETLKGIYDFSNWGSK
jgi:hypothetical protein